MPAQKLIRTIAAPIAADPDWAADPAATPTAGESVEVPPDTQAIYFTFRAFDGSDNEIDLAAMELDFTGVVEIAYLDEKYTPPKPVTQYRELSVVGGTIAAKGIAIETDLPSQAIRVFPRMRGAPTSPAAGMAKLEVYGGVW